MPSFQKIICQITIFSFWGVVFSIGTCFAETVSYSGINLPVQSILTVQGGQTKVVVGDKSFLVSSEKVPQQVVETYLTNPNLSSTLSWETFSSLVLKCLESKNPELSTLAVHETLRRSNVSLPKASILFSQIASLPELLPLFESAVLSFDATPSSPEIVCEALAFFRDAARKQVVEKAPKLVYRNQFYCSEYLQSEARRFLGEGELLAGLRLLSTLTQIYADSSEQYVPIIGAKNRLSKLKEGIDSGDYANVSRMIQGLQDDPWIAPFAATLSRGLIQNAIEKAVQSGSAENALRLLPIIDFQRRTPRDHELVNKTLLTVKDSDRAFFKLKGIIPSLTAFSRKDPKIKESFLDALERVLIGGIALEDLENTSTLFDAILALRPDPDSKNDQIRKLLAEVLIKRGTLTDAKNVADDIAASSAILLHIKLLFAGAYIESGILLALGVIVVLGVLFICFSNRAKFKSRLRRNTTSGASNSESVDRGTNDTEPPRRFVVYSHGLKLGQQSDEYSELLSSFSLSTGASLQKIKVAYRNAVKTCHPDLNPHAGEADAAKFIKLTKAYERLLKLHTARTGER